MSEESIRRSLEQLHAEIDKLDVGDVEAKDRIGKLIEGLEHQLSNPEDTEHSATLIEDFPAVVEQFEVEHPRITVILEEIIAALRNIGI